MPTISDQYRLEQMALHENPDYGVSSVAFAPLVAQLIKQRGYNSISDYGAGKKRLQAALAQHGVTDIEYLPYDPAFPEYGDAKSADLVCCIDVLEHVEPEYLPFVIDELRRLVTNAGFLTVHCSPAKKVLSVGRNAHLIQRPVTWWTTLLTQCFSVIYSEEFEGEATGAWYFVARK